MFGTACAIIAVSALFVLPGATGSTTSGYLATLRGLPGLYVHFPRLRLAASLGVALSQPPYSYSSERIGAAVALGACLSNTAVTLAMITTIAARPGARSLG